MHLDADGKRCYATSPSEHKLPTFLPVCQRGTYFTVADYMVNIHAYVQFDLVDKKELAPLDELNDAILAEEKGR